VGILQALRATGVVSFPYNENTNIKLLEQLGLLYNTAQYAHTMNVAENTQDYIHTIHHAAI